MEDFQQKPLLNGAWRQFWVNKVASCPKLVAKHQTKLLKTADTYKKTLETEKTRRARRIEHIQNVFNSWKASEIGKVLYNPPIEKGEVCQNKEDTHCYRSVLGCLFCPSRVHAHPVRTNPPYKPSTHCTSTYYTSTYYTSTYHHTSIHLKTTPSSNK
ncbi:hypothetical protein NEDG_00611 [Nematocida displodere]|uniref:Uncharacterized protein n=1 Tax=Nematocida displodere TaxID=1805483 RepID=A0A177ECC7_9MICR|nr:hypothetical protein NEDG_00611 [Nematocida displodere]